MSGEMKFLPFDEELQMNAKMKVFGVGGAGGNAVDRMIRAGLAGVEFYVVNTDLQALERSLAGHKCQIGKTITKGLGAGANPEIGRRSADQDRDSLIEAITGADIVFITAGMGGGTGTGAAPLIAELARSKGILTVAIVTKPFSWEGNKRMAQAESGIKELRANVDTLVVIPNQQLLKIADEKTTMLNAFEMADSILTNATRGISDLIAIPGIVNLDFADVRTVMKEGGDAMMGIGTAVGEKRGKKAAEKAISSPLLEDISIAGARGVLVNITGSSEMTLFEVSDAATVVYEAAGPEANVIFGAVIKENIGEEISVTVIATGFHGRDSIFIPDLNNLAANPGRMFDLRTPRKLSMDVPAKVRREVEAQIETAAANQPKGNDMNNNGKKRIHLGTFDENDEFPDINLPDFLQGPRG